MRIKSVIALIHLIFIIFVTLITTTTFAQTRIKIGFFEGGKYPLHDLVRAEFQKQLEISTPEGYEAFFVPEGFRSAEWDRDKSKMMARQLTANKNHDIMIAIGPWTVEDLLEAGYKRPIVALHRYDPIIEGLLDSKGRPIAENLSLGFEPNRLDSDLEMISRLVRIKKLAMLYFPSSSEGKLMISKAKAIGQNLGFEVVSAEGYDNKNTYAFFKAMAELDPGANVLYLPPLSGMDIFKIKEFFIQAGRRGMFVFSSEGQFLVEKGAAASNSGYSHIGQTRHAAANFWKIVFGAEPASLPIAYPVNHGLSLNLKTAGKLAKILPIDAINSAFITERAEPTEYDLYSLPQAIARTLERNPGYLARYNILEAASNEVSAVRSDYLPQIGLNGAIGYVDDNTINNSPSPLDNEQYQVGLTLSQKIFSRKTRNRVKTAQQKKIIKQKDLKQAADDLELAVTNAYLTILETEETIEALRSQRHRIDQNLEMANTFSIMEIRPRSDYIRWENLRSKLTRSILIAEAEYEGAKVALTTMMNLPPNTVLLLNADAFTETSFWKDYGQLSTHIDTPIRRDNLKSKLLSFALYDNPELQITREQIDLSSRKLTENRTRFWPEVGFQARFNLGDYLVDSPGFVEKNNTFSLLATFDLPLFHGNRQSHLNRQYSSLLEASEFKHDAISLKISNRLQSELAHFLALANSVPLTIKSKELSHDSFELIQSEYLLGKQSMIDLLMATNSVLHAEQDYILLKFEFYRSIAEMNRELGWSTNGTGDWFKNVFINNLKN